MELKIGVQHAQRELVVETDEKIEDIQARLVEALGNDGVLSVADAKGRRVVVPADKVAYLESGATVTGTVGFR